MLFCTRERPDFLQFGLQALDDTSDPRQEAARESEKEVTSRFLLSLDIFLKFMQGILRKRYYSRFFLISEILATLNINHTLHRP